MIYTSIIAMETTWEGLRVVGGGFDIQLVDSTVLWAESRFMCSDNIILVEKLEEKQEQMVKERSELQDRNREVC